MYRKVNETCYKGVLSRLHTDSECGGLNTADVIQGATIGVVVSVELVEIDMRAGFRVSPVV